MRARGGQVALYLVLVLVAVCILAVMDVSVFLCVRGKNRAMNAGDAAALAVAKHQGELLNGIGNLNVEHLKAALKNDRETCEEIMNRQLRTCFLEPLKGIGIASRMARQNRAGTWADEEDDEWKKLMREHVADIRSFYAGNPETYPEPWEGAWNEFASELELQLSQQLFAWPENAEFADIWESFPLASQDFYFAIAGRSWCWFKFNGQWMLDRDVAGMPQPDFRDPTPHFNSEIFPLHLTFRPLPEVLDEEWTNIVLRVANCTRADIEASVLLTNALQCWAFYDSRWNRWSTYDGIAFSPDEFPVVGEVKREYDVLGCAAICRVMSGAPDLLADDERGIGIDWTAAAKPFGTIDDLRDDADVVTTLRRLVVPSFTDTRLVPIDAVGGRTLHTADAEWLRHVKSHLPSSPHYVSPDPARCWYCRQLKLWNQASFRQQGTDWLRRHSGECVRPVPGSGYGGGTAHGH